MRTRLPASTDCPPSIDNRKRAAIGAALVALTTLLAACGGGSGVSSGSHTAPDVEATVIGAGAADANNTFTVRAGSLVTLSGKDSDGIDAPLLTFQWQQILPVTAYAATDADQQITLAERNSSTRVFIAPSVSSETSYTFELTGTDANGLSSSQRVTVKVEPARDTNAFLTQPGSTAMLHMRVKRPGVTDCDAAPSGGSAAAPFTLQLTEIVAWKDRLDTTLTRGPATPWQKTLSGQIDANRACVDIATPLPAIVVDDINAPLEQANRRSEELELDRVDTVDAAIAFDLTSATSTALTVNLTNAGLDISPAISSLADPDAASASFSVTYDLEDIRTKLSLPTAETGGAYYAAIDPTGYSSTLAKWLTHAGFTDASGNPSGDTAITKAIYTNNYDLGFGREMYLRKAADGSVYSYVVNYPSLENAIQGSNAFAVVAMEYSGYDSGTPAGCAADKFVKFFAFVPDQINGGFKRMPTMNFDGRGEKAVPGVCTACHGGTLQPIEFSGLDSTTHCGKADIDSTFMPWDMNSLLYSDNDPSLNTANLPSGKAPLYTRSAQQAQFRKLNEGALATYLDDPTRHDASIRLIHGWYGERDADDGTAATYADIGSLPAVDFDGSYVQSGWRSTLAEQSLYHDVFASNCRGCHTQLNPGTGATAAAKLFTTYADFMSEIGSGDEKLRDYVFESGIMPFARLTMDRFWVAFDGGESAAQMLRTHLQDNGFDVTTTPGDPIARFSVAPTSAKHLGTAITFDASSSLFVDSYLWSVSPSSGLDLSNSEGQSIGASASATGTYTVQLTASSAQGSSTTSQSVSIDNLTPVAADFTAAIADGAASISIDLTNYAAFTAAGGSLGDGFGSVVWTGSAAGSESISVADNVLQYSNSGSTASDISSAFNYLITDANGDTDTGTITIVRSSTAARSLAQDSGSYATASIKLDWTAASSTSVAGYRLTRNGGPSDPTYITVAGGTTATYTDTSLQSNTHYTYTIASLDSGNAVISGTTSSAINAGTQIALTDLDSLFTSHAATGAGGYTCQGCHSAWGAGPSSASAALSYLSDYPSGTYWTCFSTSSCGGSSTETMPTFGPSTIENIIFTRYFTNDVNDDGATDF